MKLRVVALLCGVVALVAAAAYWWGTQSGFAGAPAHAATATSSAVVAKACGPAGSDSTHPGMVWVSGGTFMMGSEFAYREEGPSVSETVSGFWMDQTEVTNTQFAQFVAATGHRTLAERGVRVTADANAPTVAGSAVFQPQDAGATVRGLEHWWHFVPGADWRHPRGPGSSVQQLSNHPVVHIAFEDAAAYAKWKGHSLPTEAQFEYAAQGSARKDAAGHFAANTWQGSFPARNDSLDGYVGTAPVACFNASALGLYDLIGNVWEWTASPYYETHDFAARAQYPQGLDPKQPGEAVAVLKGGSYLCSPDYCMRYRPEARLGQSKGLGTSHIGFRTVLNSSQ